MWRFWPHLWQNGGEVLDDEGQPAFNSEAGLEALEYWRQLAVEDESVYLDQNGEKYATRFYSGNIGMISSGPWVLSDLKEAQTPYGVTLLRPTVQGYTAMSLAVGTAINEVLGGQAEPQALDEAAEQSAIDLAQ